MQKAWYSHYSNKGSGKPKQDSASPRYVKT